MRKHRTLNVSALISTVFIFSIILSSCTPDSPASPAAPDELQPFTAQNRVDIPGGLMEIEDGLGNLHPAVVFDFQIQSRLVSQLEYSACVEAGACESVGDLLYPAAPAGVNWYQAQSYCSYLGGRLPTEAELTRATQSTEDCPDNGSNLVIQEGFGEWVYDWDDPDYYNRSLSTNPFGPLYGDLKVAMGLDLDAVSAVMGKYWIKWGDLKLDEIKLDEIKLDEIKLDEIKLSEIKLDEIKFDVYKFFSKEDWQYSKEDWHYSIKVEDGKWFITTDAAGHDKWVPGEGSLFPRMGMLPDQSNSLVGFRCVTEGAALTYAPICKTQTATLCSLPAEQMETISAQLSIEGGVNPNFQIVGANCPQGDTFALTISHDLTSGEGVEVKAAGKECLCQEYADYPGKLYCDCPSPGAGVKTEISACGTAEETLIPMNDFCPDGSYFDLTKGGCAKTSTGTPVVYSLLSGGEDSGASACPSGPGLPVPQYGPLSVAAANLEGIGEIGLPEGDQWDLFSLSDGSGMCPPGYSYNEETGCCSPYSGENYDCGPQEYFDAGKKQCLPVDWDGCGPCQVYDAGMGCVALKNQDMISGRCNTDDNPVEFDDYGRQPESSEGCESGSYKEPGLGRCIETRDGCSLGYYLDSETGTCRPLSGHRSPCEDGYTYHPLSGCCVPSPGTEGSECPEGTEFDGTGCTSLISGCPPTHYYDEETNSCLLREPGDCPGGTTKNLIGKCIPDIPGDCPDGTNYYPTSGSCPSGPPDPALCTGDKVFDASVGYCVTNPGIRSGARSAGRCDLEDLDTVDPLDEETPELAQSCAGEDQSLGILPFEMSFSVSPADGTTETVTEGTIGVEINGEFIPVKSYQGGDETAEGAEASSGASEDFTFDDPGILDEVFHCLMLTADKTHLSGQAYCQSGSKGKADTEGFFSIWIEPGQIARISRISPDTLEPSEAAVPPEEGQGHCSVDYIFGAAPDTDSDDDENEEEDWSEPVSGALPGASACIPNLLIDAGAIFGPKNCATLTTIVPICAAPVKPSGGGNSSHKCSDLTDKEDCYKGPGCGWIGKCVPCTSLTVSECINAGPGCKIDPSTNSCVPN